LLEPGGRYSGNLIPETYLSGVDNPIYYMEFYLSIGEVDNEYMGSEVTITVKSKAGKILGQKPEYYSRHVWSDDNPLIEVQLSGNQDVTDYVVTFDVVYVPSYVIPSKITSDFIINNNSNVPRTVEIEFSPLKLLEGNYEIDATNYTTTINLPAYDIYHGNIVEDLDFFILSPTLYAITQEYIDIKINGAIYRGATINAELRGNGGTLLSSPAASAYPLFWFNLSGQPLQDYYNLNYSIRLN